MIRTIPDGLHAESATKQPEREEIPTAELPVTDDSNVEKGKKKSQSKRSLWADLFSTFLFPFG